MFEAVQKVIKDALTIKKFSEIHFSDLVSEDKSYTIRKLIDASVQVETSDSK